MRCYPYGRVAPRLGAELTGVEGANVVKEIVA